VIVVLAGGVGAAKLLRGLVEVVPAYDVTAIVNVADDFELHGLAISPDLDTCTYTLADAVNPDTGWGRGGETWAVMDELERYGGETWFRLGDSDLALHLFRTQRYRDGATLSTITAEVTAAWNLECRLLPVTDQSLATRVGVPGEGELAFQDWFVGRRHDTEVESVHFAGAEAASAAPGVIEAIESADAVIIAPSNPIVSIAPLLAVPGVREAVSARRSVTAAVSPIVGGRALKGPADRLMTDLGHEASVVGVARLYSELAATLIIDELDRGHRAEVDAIGMRPVVTDTIMSDVSRSAALSEIILAELGAKP
jgi:LPPG:FO 2-phospho-L-lactate transferase